MEKMIKLNGNYVDWDIFSDPIFDSEGNESHGEEYIKIENLFVKPEFRGNGVARSLMTQAIAKIKNDFPGLKILIVAQPKDDTTDFSRLAAFYDSLGLEVV